MKICGIMTGTSLDACDVAICDIREENGKHKIELISFDEFPYPEGMEEDIFECINMEYNAPEISDLHFDLARFYADAFRALCENENIDPKSVEAIGIHGQTIFHEPPNSTLQLGNISALATLTEIKTLGDFRSADLILGGQGAPLVPIFDFEFLRSNDEARVALNIGGMANITYLPKSGNKNEVIAFDTGPGNVMINAACQKAYLKDYDANGDIARSGELLPEMLDRLMGMKYISAPYPKSTGRELFNDDLLIPYYNRKHAPQDIIRTLTEFTALSIAKNIEFLPETTEKLFISGGGAKNSFLVERIAAALPDIKITDIRDFGINPDAKEAMCFAYLAYRTLHGLPSNMPSVTGASRECVLGVIAPGN